MKQEGGLVTSEREHVGAVPAPPRCSRCGRERPGEWEDEEVVADWIFPNGQPVCPNCLTLQEKHAVWRWDEEEAEKDERRRAAEAARIEVADEDKAD
jgi:hypothetical protein